MLTTATALVQKEMMSRPVRSGTLLLGALALLFAPDRNVSANTDADDPALVERGAYLALAADCTGCHTAEGGEPFAGGRPIESPLGTLYTSNITTDPEHGIGDWTQEDFKRALRLGINHDGEYIYPAMPYVAFTKITDEDIAALWAWQRSLEPSDNEPPENEMTFPANIRTGLGVWQAVEFEAGRFEPDEERDEEYNRGAYLVEALGHCSSCHTPRTALFAQDEDRRYTGAEIHGWYAPAIGPGKMSEIADWSVDELADFLYTGETSDNQKAAGMMARVVHESLSQMEKSDVYAMARYLKEMPVANEEVETEEVAALSPEEEEAGRSLYAGNCLGCHQSDGLGIEQGVPSLVGASSVVGREPNTLIMIILEGHQVDETWAAMPSFANDLSSRDIALVANYVRTAWGNDGTPDVTFEKVNELRELAEIPEGAERATVNCPVLSGDVLEPALEITQEQFEAARNNSARVAELVEGYREERADSPLPEVVNALSAAYCRYVSTEGDLSAAEQQMRIAAFAGQVAVAGGGE